MKSTQRGTSYDYIFKPFERNFKLNISNNLTAKLDMLCFAHGVSYLFDLMMERDDVTPHAQLFY